MTRMFVNDVGGEFKTQIKSDDGRTICHLLWGDPVDTLETKASNTKVRARGVVGWVSSDWLGSQGLLEVYVIDVGQGDGVLVRTPDDKWHLIDAGTENAEQMTRKGAANFVRWKFLDDLGVEGVRLENVIVTHPDFDHYGGLIDLLAGKVTRPDRTFPVEVKHFYHCGMGRFADEPKLGSTVRGRVDPLPHPVAGVASDGEFITELLSNADSFLHPARPFDAGFARLAALVGTVPDQVSRLSDRDQYLAGYEQGAGDVTIRLLGPVLERIAGDDGLRVLGGESVTRNGHSVVLRVDYGAARILLAGDSNKASQMLLLSYHDPLEFAADVAKGCHHGSDDIDLQFVQAMKARATVISSGDNEDYAHPRPRVLGASARYGREAKSAGGELLPPLLYSTELARSVKLAPALRVREIARPANELRADQAEIRVDDGGTIYHRLDYTPISTDLIYGLINIRTDGARVLCGYMKEGSNDFDIQVFQAGVDP
jgi:beta-lactamase superfamily II metal-dependent hydrolase